MAFTITGSVRTVDGEPPPSGSPVFVYKVDAAMSDLDNIMQYPDIDEALAPEATYRTQTDRGGDFAITLFPPEVATASGEPASIAVAFFSEGERTKSLATTSGWLQLLGGETELDVGTLRLWDAGTAALDPATRVITFDWSASSAPGGEQQADDLPSHVYAWDAGSVAANPRWSAYSFVGAIRVPRAAFADASPEPPTFFVTSFAREVGGERVFQHRTAVKGEIAGWTAAVRDRDLTAEASFKVGTPAVLLPPDAIADGDFDTTHQFMGTPRRIYVDLGTSTDVAYLLLYRLGVAPAGGGSPPLIRFSTSTDDVADPADAAFVPAGESFGTDWAHERGYYIAACNLGAARWLRVHVEASDGKEAPAFASLAEIRVFGP